MASQIDVCESMFLVFLAMLGIYGLVQGYRVWRNPIRWKALGLHWYSRLGGLAVPKEQRSNLEEIWANQKVVRAFAFVTIVLSAGGLIVLLIAFTIMLTE